MILNRFMIAAAHKSAGKTVISTGLAGALRRAGDDVRTFKKGPDYIDPMWLSGATGRPCYNVDFNTMPRDTITRFFASHAGAGSLSLVEANKGLFDGVQVDGSDSNAAMAKLLGLPVILVIDTVGMTRGIAPLLMGYQTFDSDLQIAGLILNKVGGARHEGKLRVAVETYCDLPVLGSVWRDPKLEIGERHLGLTTPAEISCQGKLISGFTDVISQSVDLEAVHEIARSAVPLPAKNTPKPPAAKKWPGLRIGILRDEAFGFYYPDDLDAFKAAGAILIPIDAINDQVLPDIDGLFIGGGFPECRMEALSANSKMRAALLASLTNGLPCYAECGGMMYLCESLSWKGDSCPMVGMIKGRAVMHSRPQGRGQVVFQNSSDHPWGMGTVSANAHEFHYANVEGLDPKATFAREMNRGHGLDGQMDGIVVGNTLAGFCHLRNTGNTPWVDQFLGFVARIKAP